MKFMEIWDFFPHGKKHFLKGLISKTKKKYSLLKVKQCSSKFNKIRLVRKVKKLYTLLK